MSLAFEPSWAVDLELMPGGDRFFPRIGDDMEAAEHSIHINQFGYKPGELGDDATKLLISSARKRKIERLLSLSKTLKKKSNGRPPKIEKRLQQPSKAGSPPNRTVSRRKENGWKPKSPNSWNSHSNISDLKETSGRVSDITATGWKP